MRLLIIALLCGLGYALHGVEGCMVGLVVGGVCAGLFGMLTRKGSKTKSIVSEHVYTHPDKPWLG